MRRVTWVVMDLDTSHGDSDQDGPLLFLECDTHSKPVPAHRLFFLAELLVQIQVQDGDTEWR